MSKSWLALYFAITLSFSALSQEFVPYPKQDILSWDTSPFESYSFSNIPFRIMFPPGYDSLRTEKYPLIMFFHGAGERGTDNEKQLVHGGQSARNAVNSGEFPGILFYPQHNNGGGTWGSWIDRAKDVVDKLLLDYNLDPNRIYVHGLSGGGEATWRFAGLYPTYPAAIQPMSAAGSNFIQPDPGIPEPTAEIPIWSSQGGRDTNPTPAEGNFMVNTVRDLWGGNIRYTYYPTLGHNTWNSQYNQPDFFSWFTSKRKTDITIKFGDGSFCSDDIINVSLAVTPGFTNYEWTKNDTTSATIASGASQNEIVVTDVGLYYVRFQRGSEWTKWSKPADINRNRVPSPTPSISANGSSVNLPSLDGSQSVTLSGPDDKNAYQWFVNTGEIVGATNDQLLVNQAGSYSLSTREAGQPGFEADGITPTEYRPDPQGCPSLPSPPIVVTTENGVNTPAKPSNFFANVLSENSIIINWDDNAADELAFEIYRTTSAGSNYSLIQIVGASSQQNPQSYIDTGLNPNVTYYYRMRAVNNSGGSAYTQEVSATTLSDTQPPTAPILVVSQTTNSSIALSWSGAIDNAGIFEYDVYRNNALIASVDASTYTNTGLPINQFFSYVVRARDISGNVSPPSNQVTAATINGGLHYDYYHHNNLSNVSQIETNGTLIESGNTNNFDISIRQQNDRFAFVWEGFVSIQTAGNYTFYTDSDDGSKLFINDIQIVNNDGTHGCRERNGSIALPEGFAAIRVLMFENGGGQCLDVEWNGPGISKGNIPDHLLFETAPVFPTPPNAPSGLVAIAADYDQIDLTWADNSLDENGFEIYRSTSSTEGFTLVHLASANELLWSDTGLLGGTTYYYKITAVNLNGSSDFNGPVSAITNSYPATPAAPSDLTLQALNASNVQIDWVDNSSNETGFEIYRTTTDPGSSFATDYALTFDGNNDYVAIDNFFYNSSGIPEMTFEAWVRTSSGSDQILSSFDKSEYYRVEINGEAAGTGQVGFGIYTNSGLLDLGGNVRIDDGIWHHVAAVYDNGVASIYIDGVLDASAALGSTFGSGNTRYGFFGTGSEASSYNGPQGPNNYFNGSLEEIRIWSRARTAAEINDFMTAPLIGNETGLDVYFQITTGSGSVISDYSTTGATGNLISGPTWTLLDPALISSGLFTKIHTTAPNVTTYTDTQVFGNSTYYYKIRAAGIGSFSTYSTTESVTTPNRAPIIAPILDRSVKFETTLILPINADDPDGDPITFSFTNPLDPSFMTFTDNGYGSGEFTFSPLLANAGSYIIEITADDGSGGTDTESFTITVSDNDNPVIDPIANYTVDEGFTEMLDIYVTDNPLQQPNITLTAENLPYFVQFVDNGNGNGTFTISPTIGDAGNYPNIRVIAADGDGGFSEETFQISVNEIDPFYSLFINFSTSSSTGPAPWNNFISTNGGQQNNNLISNEGVTTDISFRTFDATNAKFSEAYLANLNSGLYVDDILETFWLKPSGTVTMRVQNLNPSLYYDLSFFSGVNDDFIRPTNGSTIGQNKTTRFTINGEVLDLDAVDNVTNTAQFTEIQPDANNEIVIQVTKTAGSNPYFVLNALTIDAYFNDGQPPAAPANLNLTATSSSTVDLTWDDNSNNEIRFEVLRSEISETGPFLEVGILPINSTSFTDNNLDGSTTYYYKVQAVNNNGQAETAVGFVTTLNAPPVIDPIDNVVLRIGESAIVPINATDPEGNTIFLSSPNPPSFVTLIDNGDGTGYFEITPTASDLGFSGTIILNAIDNFSSESTASFLITVLDQQYSELVYINFNLSANGTAPWNNLEANPTLQPTYSGFASADDVATSMGLQVGLGWAGVTDVELSSGNNSYLYQDNVVSSAWFTSGTASLTLTGLDPSKFYNIDLFASTKNWERTRSNYTIDGKTIQADATNNTTEILAFNSLTPNTSGEIEITVDALTNTINTYINALVVKSTTSDIPLNPTQLNARGTSRSEITLSWQDNSFNETGFEIYRTDEPGKAFTLIYTTASNETSFIDGGHTQNSAFIYKVRAIGSAGNSSYTNESRAITIDHRIHLNINANISGFLQASSPWNNTNSVVESGFILANLNDEEGSPTLTDFHVVQHAAGNTNNTGTQTGDDSGIYPDAVMQGYYYLNSFEQSTFELNELDNDLVYDLTFFGSEDQFTPSFGSGIVDFLSGGEKRTLFTEFNTTESVTISSINPNELNTIPFIVQSSDDNGSRFGFFNALVIDAHKSIDVVFDKTAPTVPADLIATAITGTSLTLDWSPSADNVGVNSYMVYQNGVEIGTPTTETYDVTGLIPGFTYTFTIRANDENENISAFSDPLVVTTLGSVTPTYFYSPISGTFDISDVNNWGTNTDGSGTKATNFTSDNQQFILQADATLSSLMTVNGISSKIVVEDNVTLTLNENLTATIEGRNFSNILVNSAISPSFDLLAPNSTVTFSATTNNIPVAQYGNVVMANNGSVKTLSTGNISIEGNLTIDNGISILGATPNASEISIKGNFIIHGAPNEPSSDQLVALRFNSGNTQSLTIDADQNIHLHSIRISDGTELFMNPPISTGTMSLGSPLGGGLVVESGAQFNLGNQTLAINGRGSINGNGETGRISTSKGNIEINSNSQSNSNLYLQQDADSLTNLRINLTTAGELNIQTEVNIINEVEITDGQINLASTLKLISTDNQTARIAEIQNRGRITGNVEAQRFMEGAGRIYRYMATPILGTTIYDWQQYIPVTGNFTGASTGPGLSSNPSLFYFDESNGGWISYPEISNQEEIEVGRGYAIFVREGTNPTTLRLTGEVYQGDHSFNITEGTGGDDGWNLLGNPYPSPIVWGDLGWNFSGIGPGVSIRDNTIGDFQVYDKDSQVGDPDFPQGHIASGQAFWVQAFNSTPSISISESAKTPSPTTDAVFFRNEEKQKSFSYIRISFEGEGENDYNHLLFDSEYVDAFDPSSDVQKRLNDAGNLYTQSTDGKKTAINKLSDDFCSTEIPIKISEVTSGNYTITLDIIEEFIFDPILEMYDNLTEMTTPLSNNENFNFEIQEGDLLVEDRFVLKISKPDIDTDVVIEQSTSEVCISEGDYKFTVKDTQRGVVYSVLLDNLPTGHQIVGNGTDIETTIDLSAATVGNHTITIDAGFASCDSQLLEEDIQLELIASPEIEVINNQFDICKGDSLTLFASSDQSDMIYIWYVNDEFIEGNNTDSLVFNSVTESSIVKVGAYNTFGCVSTTENINIEVSSLEKPEIIENDDQLSTSIENADSYQWYLNNKPIAGATNNLLSPPASNGLYSVNVNLGACQSFSDTYLINRVSTDVIVDATSDIVCSNTKEDYQITIRNSQEGVTYSMFIDGKYTGDQIIGNGNDIQTTVNLSGIEQGSHQLTMNAGFSDNDVYLLEENIIFSLSYSPQISTNTIQENLCSGESVTIKASSDQKDVSYTWYINEEIIENNSLDSLTLNDLTNTSVVKVYANGETGCASNAVVINISVDTLELPVIQEINGQLLASIENADAYQWYFNHIPVIGETTETLNNPASDGIYTVEVTVGACQSISDEYQYLINGFNDLIKPILFKPNPTNGILYINHLDHEIKAIYVFDNVGKMILIPELIKDNTFESKIDLTSLNSGIYQINLVTNNSTVNIRIVKN